MTQRVEFTYETIIIGSPLLLLESQNGWEDSLPTTSRINLFFGEQLVLGDRTNTLK